MTSYKILSIQIGKPEKTRAKAGMTGHFKKPVEDAVQIDPLGLDGDAICDLDNHGGPEQAVYIFGDIDRQWWAQELDRDVPPGYFGENLLISGLETGPLGLGDILTIGDVTLQITAPRIPCATYAAHIGSGQAIKQFYAAGRPGAYGRVLVPGPVSAGIAATLTPHDGNRVTVAETMAQYLRHFPDADFLQRILSVPAHAKLHQVARARLAENG